MDKTTLERRLDAFVRERRFTIAVTFPLVGAVTLLASANGLLPPALSFNPLLVLFGVLVMRLPLVAGALPLLTRRGAIVLGALAVYTYGIELVGVLTGWPYGSFEYAVDLGPMLLDAVPVGLPVFFFPIALNAYLLVSLLFEDRASDWWVRLPATVVAVLAMDVVLDPGAVALGFWSYTDGGVLYGVPWSNFVGWVLSATVAALAFDVAFDHRAIRERLDACSFMLDDLVSFVILWGLVNAFYGQWVAVATAGLFALGLLQTDRFDFAVTQSRLLRVVTR